MNNFITSFEYLFSDNTKYKPIRKRKVNVDKYQEYLNSIPIIQDKIFDDNFIQDLFYNGIDLNHNTNKALFVYLAQEYAQTSLKKKIKPQIQFRYGGLYYVRFVNYDGKYKCYGFLF